MKGGLLFHRIVDCVLGDRAGSQQCGRVGSKNTRALLNAKFTWLGLARDVEEFVGSYVSCLRMNKAGNRKAVLV